MTARNLCAAALLTLALLQAARAELAAPGAPGAPQDLRYCGEPDRDALGRIKRSAAILAHFAQQFPCPATLEPVPSCPGWQIDHVIPLASGGCDMQENMQWLPVQIKTCAGRVCKDRWERKYHARPRIKVTP